MEPLTYLFYYLFNTIFPLVMIGLGLAQSTGSMCCIHCACTHVPCALACWSLYVMLYIRRCDLLSYFHHENCLAQCQGQYEIYGSPINDTKHGTGSTPDSTRIDVCDDITGLAEFARRGRSDVQVCYVGPTICLGGRQADGGKLVNTLLQFTPCFKQLQSNMDDKKNACPTIYIPAFILK
jgi:hypothetical protein